MYIAIILLNASIHHFLNTESSVFYRSCLFELNHTEAKKLLSQNCRAVLLHAIARSKTYKGTLAVESSTQLEQYESWKLGQDEDDNEENFMDQDLVIHGM